MKSNTKIHQLAVLLNVVQIEQLLSLLYEGTFLDAMNTSDLERDLRDKLEKGLEQLKELEGEGDET